MSEADYLDPYRLQQDVDYGPPFTHAILPGDWKQCGDCAGSGIAPDGLTCDECGGEGGWDVTPPPSYTVSDATDFRRKALP